MKLLANWIMNRIAGEGSSDWAKAMRREFDELEAGHLGWALGSVGAVAYKDIRTNWQFLMCLMIGGWLFATLVMAAVFWLYRLDPEFTRSHISRAGFYAIAILSPLPFPFLMGMWKPGRHLAIGILGGFVSYGIGNAIFAAATLGGTFTKWFFEAMWMDTLPVYLGCMVTAALWATTAWLGGSLKASRRGANYA